MNSRPISVAFFSNTTARGGAEEHMLALLRGLDRNYFRLHLICSPEVAGKLRPDLPSDVLLFPLCFCKPMHLAGAFRLARFLRERHIDILHSHLFYSSLFASPIGWLCQVPLILETPHLREHWRQGWLTSHFVVDRLISRCVDCFIAVSEANARHLVEHKGLPVEKISVILNGCDVKRFDPERRAPASMKQALRFAEDDPILLVAARLEPQKGHCVLLEALLKVRAEFPKVRTICLGEGCLRNALERQTQRLGLQESVRFLGYQQNVEDWLALTDITVLPSLFEGLPLAAIESLAAGRPMVASAVDGTPEVIVDEKTGLLVPAGDADSLANAICRLLGDSDLRHRLGRAGRGWVLKHFNQSGQIQQTADLYLRAFEQSFGFKGVPAETVDFCPSGSKALPTDRIH